MDRRIDLTLRRDFDRKADRNRSRRPELNFSSPSDNEIQCGFATGSLDEIKNKRRVINIHHATEGDRPECLRCGTRIIYGDEMTCKKCEDDYENEKLESDIGYYFNNKSKNSDMERNIVKEYFNLQ